MANRKTIAANAGTMNWQAAVIVMLVVLLFRQQIVGHAGWSTPAAPRQADQAVIAVSDAAPGAAPLPVVITPSQETSRNVAVATRDRGGRFEVAAAVNGVPLAMVFDTGASLVMLRAEDAARVGVDTGSLNYARIVRTANGSAEAALTTIATLKVGTITLRNVSALVARPGKLDVNLLGQSFLSRMARYDVEGDRLVIRGGE